MHYEIGRNSRRCCVSGKELEPGDEFYSALIDTVTGLQRCDYAPEHWTGPPENVFGFWRGRLPIEAAQETREPPSLDAMLELFEQFADAASAEDSAGSRKPALCYVLALLLIRRKALKLNSIAREDEVEYLVVSRPRTTIEYRVPDPQLPEERIHEVEQELTRLLESVGAPAPDVDAAEDDSNAPVEGTTPETTGDGPPPPLADVNP